jgi:hypothetical protein
MSDSYPTLQDFLSDTQKEFMGCVETHLDPPEQEDPTYRVEATYRTDEGDTVRFSLAVDETDPDISERRHMIEFESLDSVARVVHSMKRVEASQGRYFWTESQFRVAAPDVPERPAPPREGEEAVGSLIHN